MLTCLPSVNQAAQGSKEEERTNGHCNESPSNSAAVSFKVV